MGDLDYMAGVLGLPRWSSGQGPCALCQCTANGPLSYTNFQPTAPWIATCWSPAAWLAWPLRCTNPLFDLPGVTALTVALDYMHTKYLGSDQYMFASVLVLLVYYILPGSPQENLDECWNFIQEFYRQNATPHRYQYLNKLSMFVRKSGYVKLRGKAAEVKDLGPALLALWTSKMNAHIEIHKCIKMMLKLNVQMETILKDYKGSYTLPEHVAMQFKAAAFGMAQFTTKAAEHFLGSNFKLFDVTSKLHMVMHVAILSHYVSPRLTWCFMGEDMMKHYASLAASCVKGNSGPMASRKAIVKLRLAMHLRFAKCCKL